MKKTFLILSVILFLLPLSPKAETELREKEDVFNFLKKAFTVQVSLSEQSRTREEINKLLIPYFSEKYIQLFWDENIVEEEGKYLTYGSDFALYYIPFFHFSNDTKVVFDSNKIYVIEYFLAAEEGPVNYEDHYEGLLLTKIEDEWKIDQIMYDNIPQEIISKAYQPLKKEFTLFSFIHIRPLFF